MDVDDHDKQKSTSIVVLKGKAAQHNSGAACQTLSVPTAANQNQNNSTNTRRRKAEDKMAMIFIAIVTGWLVTNFPRILLNFQEVIFVEDVQLCLDSGPVDP